MMNKKGAYQMTPRELGEMLHEHVHGAHWVNIHVRRDGRDEVWEADWLKHVSRALIESGLTDEERGERFLQAMGRVNASMAKTSVSVESVGCGVEEAEPDPDAG